MITENDKKIIISFAKKFNVQELFLFGSSLEKDIESNDIDLAVKGIAPGDFFNFYGKLLRHLPKPVDVINMAKPSRLTKVIEQTGVKIYEQSA